ncbi:MAG: DUF4326 domain-containing protein [Actinomyces sp.]|uniref:DUF4326 domain-containing protein n=1 Tax=Actinomyces sp. TaxID=29317 RepID=UPI0026DCD019|nr:DUF4326 domain-containing protein [Actinomyces sp.]MDO4243505.1 DUF4326 domain-containing protein [Actinomyces sp.]
MSPQRIQRRRSRGWRMPESAVYVGRPGQWGNPYRAARAGSTEWVVEHRGHVVKTFASGREARAYAVESLAADLVAGRAPWTLGEVRERLTGRDLACWCPLDFPCHADLLLGVANQWCSP